MRNAFLKLSALLFLILCTNAVVLRADDQPLETASKDEAGYACGDQTAGLSNEPGLDPKVAELRRDFETSRKCE